MPNFSRDKESNVRREGSTGENLSWQKSLANSKKEYTEFIQAALLTTSLLVNLNLGQQLSKWTNRKQTMKFENYFSHICEDLVKVVKKEE